MAISTRVASTASRSGITGRKRPLVKSCKGEAAAGCRSMPLGVKTTSGLRHRRKACRRSMWKYWAAVVGWQICTLSRAAKLQEALQTRAGVLRPLPLVTVRQQQDQPREQSPLVFARGDELIDINLRAVGEISELRFPQHQRLRIIAAVAIFETHHRGFRERRVVNFKRRLLEGHIRERRVRGLRLRCQTAWRAAG